MNVYNTGKKYLFAFRDFKNMLEIVSLWGKGSGG